MYDSRERGSFLRLPNPSFLPLEFLHDARYVIGQPGLKIRNADAVDV